MEEKLQRTSGEKCGHACWAVKSMEGENEDMGHENESSGLASGSSAPPPFTAILL